MIVIEIRLDVKNAPEVVKTQKGPWIAGFAKVFLGENNLKKKVEKVMGDEILKALHENISKELVNQGVVADFEVKLLEST